MHLKKLDLNSLVVFHAVWTHKSVTRAAEELHVAQPTVSTCLARLREYFDDALFTWEGAQMTPTAKARQLAIEVSEVVERASNLIQNNKFDPLQVARSVAVASADYVFAMFGAALNQQIEREAPKLQLSFFDATAEMFPRGKSSQPAELYIFPEEISPARGMRYMPLLRDQYVVVQSRDAAERPQHLDTRAFLDWPKVLFSVDHRRLSNHELNAFVQAGEQLSISMLVPNYLAIPRVLAGTSHVAVMPRNVLKVTQLADSLHVVPSCVNFPSLSLGMYWDPIYEKDLVHIWLRQAVHKAAQQWQG